jgi:hypothetical protein
MDRRDSPRRVITWRARLAYDTRPLAVVEGRLADISQDGLCFISDTLFKEKAHVILLTQAPPRDNSHAPALIEIRGFVAHCHHADMHFKTGVHISKITQGEAVFKQWCPD